MTTITIRNNYTGNETRVRADVGSVFTAAQCRRIALRLHASDCTSGGPLGERGPQDFAWEPTADGGVRITRIA